MYQINVPQRAVEGLDITVNTESPLDFLKSLESMDYRQFGLEQFVRVFGITQNAQLVFNDWDSNGE